MIWPTVEGERPDSLSFTSSRNVQAGCFERAPFNQHDKSRPRPEWLHLIGMERADMRLPTLSSNSCVAEMGVKVRSTPLPFLPTSPSLSGSWCLVLPSPRPAVRKLSRAISENRALNRSAFAMRSAHVVTSSAFSSCSPTWAAHHLSMQAQRVCSQQQEQKNPCLAI